MKYWRDTLADREAQGLYRRRKVVEGMQTPELIQDGRPVLSFCSNDYLGLAADPRLAEAMIEGVRSFGVGAGAAHLISGHTTAHHALEEELAEFTGREAALLFSTGYMANMGVISALLGRSDSIIQDKLNHASLIDGGVLSRAKLKRYTHTDIDAANKALSGASGNKLLATDGVFSMDGDIAPLAELAQSCKNAEAMFMVDDAHGIGVLGEQGQGCVHAAGLANDDVPVYMATLGKAVGTAGAFVAGSKDLIEYLIQAARPYIYTTAMPAAVAEATRASLKIVQEEAWRRQRLSELVKKFRNAVDGMGLELMDSSTPIQPIVLGDVEKANRWGAALLEQGIQVTAIRPPTVPEGTARLRVTLSAAHSDEHLDRLLSALADLADLPGAEPK